MRLIRSRLGSIRFGLLERRLHRNELSNAMVLYRCCPSCKRGLLSQEIRRESRGSDASICRSMLLRCSFLPRCLGTFGESNAAGVQ